MVVSKFKSNANKDIATLASTIVGKWKKAVQQQQSKKAKMTVASPPAVPAASTPVNDTGKFTGDKAKRKWESEGVSVVRTGVPTRDACVGLIYNGLAFMSEESSTRIIIKAVEVEQAAYDEYKGDNGEYRSKLRSLFQNLKAISNRELGPRVLSGEIPPARFVTMSHEDLKSAERKEEDKKLQYDNMKKAQVPMAEKSISDALRCGRCGQKKVSYSQAQTRSADEPMTTFCECMVCGNRWKVIYIINMLDELLLIRTVLLKQGTLRDNFDSLGTFMDWFGVRALDFAWGIDNIHGSCVLCYQSSDMWLGFASRLRGILEVCWSSRAWQHAGEQPSIWNVSNNPEILK